MIFSIFSLRTAIGVPTLNLSAGEESIIFDHPRSSAAKMSFFYFSNKKRVHFFVADVIIKRAYVSILGIKGGKKMKSSQKKGINAIENGSDSW